MWAGVWWRTEKYCCTNALATTDAGTGIGIIGIGMIGCGKARMAL